jgi:hypothetical protein
LFRECSSFGRRPPRRPVEIGLGFPVGNSEDLGVSAISVASGALFGPVACPS